LAASFTAANTVFSQANSTAQQQSSSASSNTSDKSGLLKAFKPMHKANGILIQMCFQVYSIFFLQS